MRALSAISLVIPPWQHINILLSKKISHNECNVWSGVVVLQRNGMLTHKRDDVGLQNLIAVACTSQISVNDHKRRSCVSCYSAPYHYIAPAKETTFNNTVILVPFSNSTVYPGTTITAIQVERDSSENRIRAQSRLVKRRWNLHNARRATR